MTKRRKISVVLAAILAIFYSIIVLNLVFGRNRIVYDTQTLLRSDSWWIRNINLIPFKTIVGYIDAYINDTMNLEIIVSNLFGNIILFAPCGVFLPFLFKSYRKWGKYIITMVLVLVCVELIQLCTGIGALDIDDFILNILGVVIAYAIFNCKWIKNLIEKWGIY